MNVTSREVLAKTPRNIMTVHILYIAHEQQTVHTGITDE